MYHTSLSLVIGFHGCDKSIRDAIVNSQSMLHASKNQYDWLGHGMYFWENNSQRALHFAQELKKRPQDGKKPINEPAVLGAVINLGLCLDLLDKEYIDYVNESFETVRDSYASIRIPLPQNISFGSSGDRLIRRLDCTVIEYAHFRRRRRKARPFDSVRGVFIEGAPIYPTAGFYEKSHSQLCIRNPNCIKGFFIPRETVADWVMP